MDISSARPRSSRIWRENAKFYVRGIRNGTDYDYEAQLNYINMDMYKEMQEELSQKEQGKDSIKPKKAPKPKAVTPVEETDKMYCPECGEPLVFEEGCNICKNCGWSKCH